MSSPDTRAGVDGLNDGLAQTKLQQPEAGGFFGRNRFRIPGKWLNIAGTLLLTATSIPLISTLLEKGNVQAKEPHFPDPAPRKPLEVKGVMSSQQLITSYSVEDMNAIGNDHPLVKALDPQKAEAQPVQVAKEVVQSTNGHIEFDIQGDHYIWDVSNASFGIYPPNDPNRNIGTVRVAINGDWTAAKYFQPLVTVDLYPEIQLGPGVGVTIGGIAVNVLLDKYYLGTATTRNDGNDDPKFELGTGIKTAENYTDRVVIRKGLPQGGRVGLSASGHVILDTDTSGNYANYLFSDCLDPAENGTYQIRLDSLGNPIGDTFIKLPDPTPTPTPTPSPTPTTYQTFIPFVTRDGSVGK